MKKLHLFIFLISVSIMSCVTEAANKPSETTSWSLEAANRPLYEESEIIFSFDGPQNVIVSLYQNGQFLKTISIGNKFEKIVPNGSYTFVAQIGERDSMQITAGNSRLSKELTVNARNNSVYVKIVASIKPSGVIIDDFLVTNTVQLPPVPDPRLSAEEYFGRGNNRAIVDYNRAIRINPNYADAYFNRGYAYGEKKDYDRAIEDYTQAIRINPNYAWCV